MSGWQQREQLDLVAAVEGTEGAGDELDRLGGHPPFPRAAIAAASRSGRSPAWCREVGEADDAVLVDGEGGRALPATAVRVAVADALPRERGDPAQGARTGEVAQARAADAPGGVERAIRVGDDVDSVVQPDRRAPAVGGLLRCVRDRDPLHIRVFAGGASEAAAVASANGQPVWRGRHDRLAQLAVGERERRRRVARPRWVRDVDPRRRKERARVHRRSLSAPEVSLAQSPLGGAQPAAHPQPPARDHRIRGDRPRVHPRCDHGLCVRLARPGHADHVRPPNPNALPAADQAEQITRRIIPVEPPWRECPVWFGRPLRRGIDRERAARTRTWDLRFWRPALPPT